MKENVILYHGNCSDGTFSAWCAWKKFKDNATYIPMIYKNDFNINDLPEIENKNVYIFDFSFEKEIVEYIQSKAKSFILLDHHEGAYKKLSCCKNCFFDLKKSGAMISWNYFFPNVEAPNFIKYIQDGDLFKFNYPETKPFYRSIENGISFEEIDKLLDENKLTEKIEIGKELDNYSNGILNNLAKEAIEVNVLGYNGYMVNAPSVFASELGSKLAKDINSFCIVWNEKKEVIKCSIRSVEEFDSTIISNHFGGGGHKCASAYQFNNYQDFINSFTKKNTIKNKI